MYASFVVISDAIYLPGVDTYDHAHLIRAAARNKKIAYTPQMSRSKMPFSSKPDFSTAGSMTRLPRQVDCILFCFCVFWVQMN